VTKDPTTGKGQNNNREAYYRRYTQNLSAFFDTPTAGYLRRYFGGGTNKRLLDAGCGVGIESHMLRQAGFRVSSLDIDGLALRIANRIWPNGLYVQADLTRLPFKDGTFDNVVCIHVLEHIPDPDGAMREIHRVCKAGARLVFITPDKNHFVKKLPIIKAAMYDPTDLRLYSRSEFASFIGKYFGVKTHGHTSQIVRYGMLNALLNRFIRPDLLVLAEKVG